MTQDIAAAWAQLQALAADDSPHALEEADPKRIEVASCYFDFSRQSVSPAAFEALLNLATSVDLPTRRRAMFAGAPINATEQRAVLHAALRGGADPNPERDTAVESVLDRMAEIAEGVRRGTRRGFSGRAIRDVVHIGIGGSHLGPELVVTALDQLSAPHVRTHFVANVDRGALNAALSGLDPETTLFIIVSKSFTTLETALNARSARSWFLERTGSLEALDEHFIAVSANVAAASEFGLAPDNVLPMWDWVGGRFSIWSAVGLPVMIALGAQGFRDFLNGARTMDAHFRTTPIEDNAPALAALFGVWNINARGTTSHAVLSYDERLALLPDYLQQLEMESNGKSKTLEGADVTRDSAPIIWGGVGTQGQHAYHQLLHQGTAQFSADVLITGRDDYRSREHFDWLNANALAQTEAFADGTGLVEDPHRAIAGGRPVSVIMLDALTPESLGMLLAAYEHKVFCQGALWQINSFDQWGVELGKQLAGPIYSALERGDGIEEMPEPTQNLIERLRRSPR